MSKLATIIRRFPSPACDSSGTLWREEVKVIEQMLRGEHLICERHYIAEGDCYAVSWYWCVEPKVEKWYPNQPDGPVMRLMGRQIIRPMSCGGGYTTMEFTERARKAFSFSE